MNLTSGESLSIDGVGIHLEGPLEHVAVTSGSRAVTLRGTRGDDVIGDLLAGSEFRVTAAIDLEIPARSVRRSRGEGAAGGEPVVVLDAPELGPGEATQVALVEQDGELRWVFPESGNRRFVVEVESSDGTDRGLLGSIARKAIKFLAVKAIKPVAGRAVASLAAAAENRLRPTRVRTFTPDNFRLSDDSAPDVGELASGPTLLLIHGTNSRTDQAFGSFDASWVEVLQRRYEGRVIAFDHPSLSVSPSENADRFAEWAAEHLAEDETLELDVLAHSRGGLVARELTERPRDRITVRSVVFVATPNNGTPLCDTDHLVEFVDTFTNLAAVIPDNPVTDALEIIFELVKDIALEFTFDSLPGIQSMNPTGEYLATLNGLPRPKATYRAIAADFEPLNTSGRLVKLRDRLFDRVFDGMMNDLVVPTRSPYLRNGSFEVPANRRLVIDSSHSVEHSTIWAQRDAFALLDEWLRADWKDRPPPDTDPATADPNADIESALAEADQRGFGDAVDTLSNLPETFKSLADQLAGGPVTRPRRPHDPLGSVVVLPGIMGSLLDAGGERIWLSPWRLANGRFADLSLDHPAHPVVASGLNPVYAPLAARLAERWNVHLFPFDWRLDINESADALDDFIKGVVRRDQPDGPVHLVAHSMGGLVARTFIGRHPKTWKAIAGSPNASTGRLVMLGTPNRGSYAIPLALAGQDIAIKGVAAIDVRNNSDQIRRIVATFPGMYQMLPTPGPWYDEDDVDDDRARLYHPASWGDVPVSEDLLAKAKAYHTWLDEKHDDSSPDRMTYIAGDQQLTPARIRVDRGEHHFGRHDNGDSRVLHGSGRLDGVDTYFVGAGHGALASDTSVLDALDGILLEGTAAGLRTERFPRRGGDTAAESGTTGMEAKDVDPNPPLVGSLRGERGRRSTRDLDATMAHSMSLYLGTPSAERHGDRALRVSVTHASLEQALHPVIVGHYRGLPPMGAEGFLDRRLGRALTHHHELGDYPRDVGEALFVQAHGNRPPGGIVIGLGDFGELSRSKLTRSIKRAVIQRVLRANEQGITGGVGVSSVLASTPGQHGLSVGAAIAALVEGAAAALVELDDMNLSGLRFEHLEVIELYEVRATQALEQLRNVSEMLPVDLRSEIDLNIADTLGAGRGGRPGLPTSGPSSEGWPRFLVDRRLPPCPPCEPDEDEDGYPCGDDAATPKSRLPRLEFTRLGRGAQVDRLTVEFDDKKVSSMISAAVNNPSAVNETFALFEMLFPHNEKLEIDDTDNLHLLVDEDTAAIPWELLCGRGDGNPQQALAMRSGLLRQLRPSQAGSLTRRSGRPPIGNRALVIGDPPAGDDYPRLIGARREARNVAQLLEMNGFEVERLIFDDDADEQNSWLQVQTALYARPYRVVHFASHGEVHDDHPDRTGLLIGPDKLITALDIQQMSVTPDFVFLNACHVGRTGSRLAAARSQQRVNQLAANLSLQLLRNGVRAVVAAGWAVDDNAAVTFADTLYGQLLNGEHYGDAVHQARKETFDQGRTNTWGAYQCYGDPSFSLRSGSRVWPTPEPVSPQQLIQQLDVLSSRAGDETDLERLRDTHGTVVEHDDRDVERFPEVAVYEALGRAYAELGCYADATWAYRQALRVDAPRGLISMAALERLSNMEAFLAVTKELKRPARLPVHHPIEESPGKLFDTAEGRIKSLIRFNDASERHTLLGGTYKKRAATVAERFDKRRRGLVVEARNSYRRALVRHLRDEHCIDQYSGPVWVQMSRLAGPTDELELQRIVLSLSIYQHEHDDRCLDRSPDLVGALIDLLDAPDDERTFGAAQRKRLEVLLPADLPDPMAPIEVPIAAGAEPPPDFWADSNLPHLALTQAVLNHDLVGEELKAALEVVGDQYLGPFENRSTIRKRHSAMQHVADLAALLPEHRRAPFNELAERLDQV